MNIYGQQASNLSKLSAPEEIKRGRKKARKSKDKRYWSGDIGDIKSLNNLVFESCVLVFWRKFGSNKDRI